MTAATTMYMFHTDAQKRVDAVFNGRVDLLPLLEAARKTKQPQSYDEPTQWLVLSYVEKTSFHTSMFSGDEIEVDESHWEVYMFNGTNWEQFEVDGDADSWLNGRY